MGKLRAVVWDLDGTLLDTLQDLASATNYALAAHGLPPRTDAEVRRFVGNGAAKLIRRAVPAGTDEQTARSVFDTFAAYYGRHNQEKTAPYAGIPEGLHALRQAGVVMAVVSNKLEPAVEALRQRFFAHTIAVAVGDIPGRPVKPAPEGTLLALERLGVSPEEALFVGDSDVDVETARNAGMECLSVSWGFRDGDFLRQQGATAVADTPAQAFEWIIRKTRGEEKHG